MAVKKGFILGVWPSSFFLYIKILVHQVFVGASSFFCASSFCSKFLSIFTMCINSLCASLSIFAMCIKFFHQLFFVHQVFAASFFCASSFCSKFFFCIKLLQQVLCSRFVHQVLCSKFFFAASCCSKFFFCIKFLHQVFASTHFGAFTRVHQLTFGASTHFGVT